MWHIHVSWLISFPYPFKNKSRMFMISIAWVFTSNDVYTVGSSATVFLDIKGRIDVDKEITKAKTRLQKADEAIQKQRKILGAGDFEEKVSEAVKEIEREKLKAAETESKNLERSIEQFEKLKLGE